MTRNGLVNESKEQQMYKNFDFDDCTGQVTCLHARHGHVCQDCKTEYARYLWGSDACGWNLDEDTKYVAKMQQIIANGAKRESFVAMAREKV
jgi:hypothetical protein